MTKCCSRCHISVFQAEQVHALGQLYHKQCFQCSNPSCHRLLDVDAFKVNEGKIFCNFCYEERVHKSKFSNSILGTTNRLNTEEEIERAYQPAAYSIKKYDQPPKQLLSSPTEVFVYQSLDRKENKKIKTTNSTGRTVVVSSKIAPVQAKVVLESNLLKPNDCNRCRKKVYEAEKMTAAGHVWHKLCFRCSTCGKSLEPGKYNEREHEIFCSKCYAKEFGPKGVGCGVGAGILQMHQ